MKQIRNIILNCILGVYVFISAMFLFGINGKAYIDPSAMTYVIQAVAGVVIALGAGIGIYWRRVRRKMKDNLGIKENREVEKDEIVIKDEKRK